MALITCPECNQQVSNKADICIHCGYPIKDYIENKTLYSVELKHFVRRDKERAAEVVLDTYRKRVWTDAIRNTPSVVFDGLHKDEAMYIVYDLQREGIFASVEKSETDIVDEEVEAEVHRLMSVRPLDGKLRCPHCNSDEISTGQRGFSMVTGFIGSNKTVNRCAKCGYKWQPK